MKLKGKRILLTGATGGLGQILALQLADQGAILALLGRNVEGLAKLCAQINQAGGRAIAIINDLCAEHAAEVVINEASKQLGAIDILINCAGVSDFTQFATQAPAHIAHMMYVNTIVPMQLTRALLPTFIANNTGQIVNIGSIFGSIGFPHYAVYSASKFALRGFSQALRRELFDHNIIVTYIAPRAIKTAINNAASTQTMQATNTAMDDPETVASAIIKAIIKQKTEHYIGQPESLFAWLNGVMPSLVSNGLKKPSLIARQILKNTHARGAH